MLGLMILVTLISIFTPSIHFLKVFSQYILFVMLGFLGLGFLFFIYHSERLMMWSLLCCGVLCLHLKQSSNKVLRLPAATASPSIRVSHVSLGNAEGDYNAVIEYLKSVDADLLSFQELTPDWNRQLIDKLSGEFNYIQTVTRLDQYGMGFFSKHPLIDLDTLYFESVPSLAATIAMGDKHLFTVISCQVLPPVNQSAFEKIDRQFAFLNQYIKANPGNLMVMGDFHLPPWSAEVQRFRTDGELRDGRRDMHSRNLDGSMSLPRIPVEHILFTDGLECTSFSEIGDAVVGRLGITGIYQLQYEEMAQ
jgi:hypothetical protein